MIRNCGENDGTYEIILFSLVAQKICHLLGIPVVDFTKSLIRPKVKVGREYVHKSQTKDQVSFRFSLDEKCWLINQTTCQSILLTDKVAMCPDVPTLTFYYI